MKFIIFTLFLIPCLLLSQSSLADNQNSRFFDFDQIDHYSIKISTAEISEMEFKNQKKDAFLLEIIRRNYPEKTDDAISKTLTDHGFSIKTVDKALYPELTDIFSEKECSDHIGGGFCIPTFRDILVFRKDHQVVGVVKVCYQCRFAILRGTQKNVRNFGSCGDFLRLEKLLENKP
ncbi:hypothetical protein [Chryseobacterium indologenes]|uniref:Uncharacterized protein n=1 Tax=Chryseobacterium indologenes TaxID=253 RepID=A0A0N0ZW17_CHRID|nr:hypothetical protein [Chryseobacterium indologenes]KPE50499.1 hypothetical protein AOB46_13995 [Chryseobacterium indologenes]